VSIVSYTRILGRAHERRATWGDEILRSWRKTYEKYEPFLFYVSLKHCVRTTLVIFTQIKQLFYFITDIKSVPYQ